MYIKICIISIALLFLMGVFPVQAADPAIVITDYEVTPSVLMPDEKGIVTVTLSNTQVTGTTPVLSPDESDSDFSYLTSSSIIDSVFLDGKKDIDVLAGNGQFEGKIGEGQSIKISFVIRAPPQSGLYFTQLLIRIRDHEYIKYPIAINVNTPISTVRQPALILSQSSSGPIKPGESFPVKITLTNMGISQAEDITLRVKETGLNIAPLQTNAFHIAKLRQGEESSGEITFNTDKKTTSGIHKIPVEIAFTTPDKGETQVTETISLDIRGEADVSIMSLETDPERIQENSPFDLVIRLDNSGTGDAESVRASLDLPFQGTKEAFVGRIEPYNDAPAVFVLESGEPGDYTYNLNIEYKDDWGEHQRTENLTLAVIKPPDNTVSYIIFLILVITCLVGYRFWSRRGDV
ncbi:COG1361 S-layer family protein [Methanospirillum stamsii]|uniref:S-layer protein n=1 Tax=Methanospirillum stamsii TaxID=1277351 RepID=A0A2V2NIQ9_9EURY|nr:hypothetical protein [Methanospirillum stamsii]PWR76317.1 hypothetical protein DLD82_00475 [Methanospirillum stamsii]